MMTEKSENTEQTDPANKQPDMGNASIQWRCHPATGKPLVAIGVVLFILLVSALVFYTTNSKAFTMLSLVVMFGSVAKFYFSTSYKMTDEGITIKTTTQTLHKEWSIYRSFYPDKNGVLLSPFVRPSRLENFRGLYIMFNNNRDEVIDFVKAHITFEPDVDISKKEDKQT